MIAREWRYLDPVRTLCELEDIPVQMANEEFTGVWHLRETRRLVDWLRARESRLVTSAELDNWIDRQATNHWIELLQEAIAEFALETGGTETAVEHFIEWLAEWSRDVRRRQQGLMLLTAHRAKGLEFDHVAVLHGGWDRVGRNEDRDAPRRLYYVAMTRARQTLALARLSGKHPFHDVVSELPSVQQRAPLVNLPPARPELARHYRRLSLRDIFLSFAGYRRPDDPVHRAIAALSPGDVLAVQKSKRWELLDRNGTVVGQLASSFAPPNDMRCAYATVMAVVTWDKEKSEPEFQDGLRSEQWEVVVPELIFEPE